MALFPGALPVAGTAVTSDTLLAAGHTALHNTSYDEIRALATKVGTGASTPTASTVLRGTGVGTSAWQQVALTTDVTGVLPIANGGTNASSAAAARTSLGLNTQLEILAAVYPVGCIYTTTNSTNPASILGFGTWTAFGAGRVIIGAGTSDQAFSGGVTGGESNHTLTTPEMPAHTHGLGAFGAYDSGASYPGLAAGAVLTLVSTSGSTGGGGSHNNLPPYIVAYLWQRTA